MTLAMPANVTNPVRTGRLRISVASWTGERVYWLDSEVFSPLDMRL